MAKDVELDNLLPDPKLFPGYKQDANGVYHPRDMVYIRGPHKGNGVMAVRRTLESRRRQRELED